MKSKLVAIVFVVALFSGSVFAEGSAVGKDKPTKVSNARSVSLKKLEQQVNSLQRQIAVMKGAEKRSNKGDAFETFLEKSGYGLPIFASPAFGVRSSAHNASDLMVNLSSINRDLFVLRQMKKMNDYAIERHMEIPDRPVIILSGAVEGQFSNTSQYNKIDKADVNLSRAELDIIGKVSPWATAGMIISYDDNPADNQSRVNNSRLQIDRGFLTIGNLNKFPAYATVGQLYAPFGSYSSYMLTSPMTKKLGRTKDRMVVLGYNQYGIVAQLYGFAGEIKRPSGSSQNFADHTGANLAYNYENDKFNLHVGGGIIGNLAESDGMQKLCSTSSGTTWVKEVVRSRVRGLNAHAKFNYDPFTVLSEYVGAHKKFDQSDLSFNNDGAKPQALSVETAFEFKIKSKPNTIAVGYGQTWEALALGLPKNSFFAEYNVALIKNTIFSVEYRHDINYGWKDQANSLCNTKPVTVVGLGGRHSNIITAQVGVYF